ncbi:MAG: hypothetical protein QGF30_05185 [Alphaproteobacteria bacterium]|jgi:hypothetical protein|nr:hypothetical protein [Candidatus Pacearchaeota archaeon]MDP6660907.1 hypothetical protein [Alphaproteobacteria bacterium]|tara:strand:+ start:1914 stop:2159 length:246 start_codon:yes stop_codon:yes gene_type:complete
MTHSKIWTLLLVGVFLTSLNACGIVNANRRSSEMQESKVLYKACLRKNPQTPGNCESARLAYEADLREYRAGYGGATVTVE